MPNPLASPVAYEEFVYGLQERFESILLSTLVYIPSGILFGRLEGILVFAEDLCLCVQEFLNPERSSPGSGTSSPQTRPSRHQAS